MESASVAIESCVRGHHIYQSVWNPFDGEELNCYTEQNNSHDPYTVAIMKRNTIVGHVPRKISAACYLFLEKEDTTIICIVNGKRQYLKDLPQGGLEVPCTLIFQGNGKDIAKIVKLLAPGPPPCSEPPPNKKRKTEDDCVDLTEGDESNFVSNSNGLVLSEHDKQMILDKEWLSDKHIYIAQQLLSKQFPNLSGLGSSLVVSRSIPSIAGKYLQIIHTRGNHWIVASTICCQPGEVKVFDSLYTSVDEATKKLLSTLFGKDTRVNGVWPSFLNFS